MRLTGSAFLTKGAILFVVVYLFMHVRLSYPSLFSRTCLVTLLLIPNEFGTVFEKIRRIRRTRNTIFAAGARNNFAQQVIGSSCVQSD